MLAMSAVGSARAAFVLQRVFERWRWYHFYFLLALFDLLVILASIALYHRSQRDYEIALNALTDVEARQRWVTDVRSAVVELNAPGNDIFETRRLEPESSRFGTLRGRVEQLLAGAPAGGLSSPNFERNLAAMIQAEEEIFSLFATALRSDSDAQALFDRASARMAAMDRHQADVLATLAGTDASLRREQQALLEGYRRQLALNSSAERYFFASAALALVGMFWFGRTLHRANERMLADQRRATEERHARFAAIGEVCATVAHGILNPLAGIRAAAEVAQTEGPAGPLKETLDDIRSEVQRLDVRARRLLDFSKPLEPEIARCDVRALLASVEQSLEARHKNLDVVIACPASLGVLADETMLFEVISELGANAARAMQDVGRLRIEGTPHGARVVIRVVDQGGGIPEAVQPRLFELFFTTRSGGTGLGLATVRKLMQVQGGTVELESTGPGGSVFRVELPRAHLGIVAAERSTDRPGFTRAGP